jgi:hypothetical protein
VEAFVDQQFPGKWIGRGGFVWLPLSPDLTLLDLFLWEYIKDLVYQRKEQDVEEPPCQITAACEAVTYRMMQNTWRKILYWLDPCRTTKSAFVEIYYRITKLGNFLLLSVQFPYFYLYQFRKF